MNYNQSKDVCTTDMQAFFLIVNTDQIVQLSLSTGNAAASLRGRLACASATWIRQTRKACGLLGMQPHRRKNMSHKPSPTHPYHCWL